MEDARRLASSAGQIGRYVFERSEAAFADLVRHTSLAGWLHTSTRYAAAVTAAGTASALSVHLPFLLLSFANGFYRERLLEVLRLADSASGQTMAASSSPAQASEISSPGNK